MKFMIRFLKKASSINDLLSSYLALIGGLIIVILMIVITGASVSRYFFGQASAAVTELSAFSLLLITFLGGSLLARQNGHVSVDILPNILGKNGKRVLSVFTNSVSFLVALLIAWYGIKSTISSYQAHEVVVDVIRAPKYIFFAMITFGFFLMSLSFLTNALTNFKETKDQH